MSVELEHAKNLHHFLVLVFQSEMGILSPVHQLAQYDALCDVFEGFRDNFLDFDTEANAFPITDGRHNVLATIGVDSAKEGILFMKVYKRLNEVAAMHGGADEANASEIMNAAVYLAIVEMLGDNQELKAALIELLDRHAETRGGAVAERIEEDLRRWGVERASSPSP